MCEADQGQVPYRLERGVGRAASGSTRHTCQKPLHRVQERDEALVQQWLKKDYPKIRKIAQKQGGEIYFGDAAHIRSDHHAGCTWGKKGETLIVETKGALHNMRLISAISSRGHMRFMIKTWRRKRLCFHRISEFDRRFAVRSRRDRGLDASLGQIVADRIAVIAS